MGPLLGSRRRAAVLALGLLVQAAGLRTDLQDPDVRLVVDEERLLKDLQPNRERIRDVVQGPDGALYLLTDNTEGRVLKLLPRP